MAGQGFSSELLDAVLAQLSVNQPKVFRLE